MKSNNIVQIKRYAFAIRIIKVYKHLCDDKKEFVLSKQLLRCGTSIGANIEEAIGGQSDKDFYSKLTYHIKKLEKPIIGLDFLKTLIIFSEEESNNL